MLTSFQDETPGLNQFILPHADNLNTTEKSPQDQRTAIGDNVDQFSEEPSKIATNQVENVSVSQDIVVSDVSNKPAASYDPKGEASFQENTGLITNVQLILQQPLSRWLLLHPEVCHEYFEWIGRSLGMRAIEQVYNHPDLQEFLEMALKFNFETSNGIGDTRMDDADKLCRRNVTVVEKGILQGGSSTAEVSIPGLTLENEEGAEWDSMVRSLSVETPNHC